MGIIIDGLDSQRNGAQSHFTAQIGTEVTDGQRSIRVRDCLVC